MFPQHAKAYRRTERARGNIPPSAEDEEVRERRTGRLRLRRQDAEDRGIDVVLLNAADVHELLRGVLVRHVTLPIHGSERASHDVGKTAHLLPMPCYYVKRGMLLFA